jgi:malonate-semialdehyde dehydrogenase (acetylating) / methylmalonate-semialdehyde dehydrogenase
MTTRISHWIDGAIAPGTSGRTSAVFNPATGQQTGDLDLASAAEVDVAVASAKAAAREWRHSSLSRRSAVLFAFRALVAEHLDEIAAAITAEQGKTMPDARGEVQRGLENIEYACGVPSLLKGGYSEQASTGVDV